MPDPSNAGSHLKEQHPGFPSGSGHRLGPILIHHSCQSATWFSRVSSSCLISPPGLCISFCDSLFPLNNTLEGSSVTSSKRVSLAAFHSGGFTTCPSLQPISIPLLPSGHSPLKCPLGWPGYALPSLFSLSLSNGSPHFSISFLLDHEQGYVFPFLPCTHSSPKLFPPLTQGGAYGT